MRERWGYPVGFGGEVTLIPHVERGKSPIVSGDSVWWTDLGFNESAPVRYLLVPNEKSSA